MAPPAPEVHLAVGSQFENIELVQAVLNDSLRRLRVAAEARERIDMAVREAVSNAMRHGNLLDPTKRVEVDLAVDGEDLVITVEDQGEGFDLNGLKDPLLPENRLLASGRGIFYMRRFMDQIDYRFPPGGGTVVTLRKRIPGPESGTEAQPEEAL